MTPTEERDSLAGALLDVRIACERVGYDRSAADAAEYSVGRAIQALRAAGFDAFAGILLRTNTEKPEVPHV